MTIRTARAWGAQTLSANATATRTETPALDADVLLMHVLGCDRTRLLFDRDRPLSAGEEARFSDCIARRRTGLPVAYITGHKEFFGYDFLVTQDVLIPKPDTELLVEKSIDIIEEMLRAEPGRAVSVCDMCTGSGCVGISVLRAAEERGLLAKGTARLVLADISPAALEVARGNAGRLLAPGAPAGTLPHNVSVVQSNLFESVSGSFGLITANPPYIPAAEARALLVDGRAEPLLALDGDVASDGSPSGTDDGLAVMRVLIPQAASRLERGGTLLVEAGEYNAEATAALFEQAGFRDVQVFRDLSGQPRVVCGRG